MLRCGIMMGEAIKKYNEIINEFEKCGYEAIGKVMNAETSIHHLSKKEMFLCCSKKRCYGESWFKFYDYGKYIISRSM